jgi:hypothetical protein
MVLNCINQRLNATMHVLYYFFFFKCVSKVKRAETASGCNDTSDSVVSEFEEWRMFWDKIFGLSGLQLAEAATKMPSSNAAAPRF